MPATLISLFLAAAGGGSSGFSGGGGGGGFSGGGGGGYSGGGGYYGGGGTANAGFVFGLFLLIAVFVLFAVVSSALAARRYRKKRKARVETVRRASFEAAEDDAWFAADAVVADAEKLFVSVQEAWDAVDRDRLATLVGPELMVEWRRRLDDFDAKGWHNRVKIVDGPHLEYVGLVNREDDTQDRVVVRVEAKLEDYVEARGGRVITHSGTDSTQTALCEYWTLARTDGGWIVGSIEQKDEGDHHLDGEIIASPWGDTQALHDEAVVEDAVANKVAEGFTTADIASFDFAGDARQEAMDLALQDGRFAPDVLEAAVRRAVAGWAEAVDGADDPLLAVASPQATHALLYGDDTSERTRVVVRGAVIEQVTIEAVDAAAQPARMTVAVTVLGRRYIENRDTAAVIAGDKSQAIRFAERWTLALDGPDTMPWRIVATSGAVTA